MWTHDTVWTPGQPSRAPHLCPVAQFHREAECVCVCMCMYVCVCPFTCVFVSALAAMGRGTLGGAAAPGEEERGSLHSQEALADTRGDADGGGVSRRGEKHNLN